MEDRKAAYLQGRFERLGFYPQKEIYCNFDLPYADKLDDESQVLLASIKDNLAKAVAIREMKPSIGFYFNKLLTYIQMYGLKFSKEDHIKFIKLLLSLIEIPNLEPVRLNNLCIVLSELLRKSTWLTPDDLQIEWRPLYKLSQIFMNKTSSKGDFYRYFARNTKTKEHGQRSQPPFLASVVMNMQQTYGIDLSVFMDDDEMSLESNVQYIIQQCASYFPKNSTQEILDEIYPKLLPLDTGKSCETFALLSLFLNYNHGYDLWFYDFMDRWSTYHNPTWNIDLMNKIAGLASQNIGLIDWEPYIPTLFTRILRSLDLPVCYKNMKSSRAQSLWSSSIAIWIASTLGPHSSCQAHLKEFLGAIESYLHPANTGKWVNGIAEIIVQIPKYFEHRLIHERYRVHTWKAPNPEHAKLTENCITAFVESFKPIATQAVYSRVGPTNVGRIFKILGDLRPELIIPGVVDRVYLTLDSLTEPHKMTAALQCLVSVSRALVSGHNGYTVGRTHIIPILYASLPGIDPNDFRKTSVTLEFLTSFALLVPIIDCSKAGLYYSDLTEEEMLICDQTAEFEGFVLQYLDKVFVLIESSAHESIRMETSDMEILLTKMESMVEASLQSSTHGIMGQCSQDIIAAATRKVIDFVKSHRFEPRVAGHLVASLICVFSRIAGAEMRKLFVPYLITTINTYLSEHENLVDLYKQSDELLYYIILLTSVVRGDPREVVHFIDDVIPIIDVISKFKCKISNRFANNTIINILSNVSTFQTIDVRSSPESFERPLSNFLPIRHWGEKSESPIKWYVPNTTAVDTCRKILHRYLPPLLDQFDQYVDDKLKLTREEIQRDCSFVLALLKCANFLPNWDTEPPLDLQPAMMPRTRLTVHLGFEDKTISMPNGDNVRLAVIRSIAPLQKKIQENYEEEFKALKVIIMIWERVQMRKQYNSPFQLQLKSFRSLKTFQDYNLTKYKRDIRAIWATRVLMQQDCRDEMSPPDFTESHKTILFNLLQLSTSTYSVVRAVAQAKLFIMLNTYPFAYKCILDEIVRYLALDSNEHHESFKGILYVIGGTRKGRLIVRNNWSAIEKIWLAILKTNLSEKPSVVGLLDMIMDAIGAEFPTVVIELEIPDKCVQLALALASKSDLVSATEMAAGQRKLDELNKKNLATYHKILSSILEITHNNSLHWRYGLMASGMIYNLIHPNVNYPPEVARYCVGNLINESIEERRLAIRTVLYVLKQQKPKHIKLAIDPFSIAKVSASCVKLMPGIRPDNRWLQYELASLPHNQAEWDEPRYIHKTEGFFGWSSGFRVCAPSDQQPPVKTDPNDMNAVERVLFDFFVNKTNLDRLIEFWSLEEKRGKEKFNRTRFYVVKGLCDMFGERMVEMFLPHIERLIGVDKNRESSHRCAAELMGGILRGIKHWPYAKTDALYERLKPLIRLALNSITVETDVFWGTCFATAAENFDPKRQYWLHEVLMEDPLRESTSFEDCSRIYCLQGPFNQHVWRMTSVAHRLLEYLRPYLSHSFQNVRDRLGSLLINIFEADLHFPGAAEPECPRIRDFMNEVIGKIQILNRDNPNEPAESAVATEMNSDNKMEVEASPNAEYDEAVRLFKTTCQWIIGVLNRSTNGNIPEYFELLSFACRLERCEQDTELAITCSSLLALLSQALTLSDCMGVALDRIDVVSLLSSWSARLAVIGVLQVLVFNNMFIVLNNAEWVAKVQTVVLRLLEDPVLEVREKAAQVLGGLLHCSFLPDTGELLKLFKKKCKTKVPKSSSRRALSYAAVAQVAVDATSVVLSDKQEADSIRTRHMGVLGLCAFISAYPYDIPDFIPDVFDHLGAHLNDPQPIASTIRKTVGDFKRTHHDSWATHQLKFTENQLAVLSDLTIPPSYYA